jgi:hypothetical protein
MYPTPTGASRRDEGVLKLRLIAFLAWSLPAFATAELKPDLLVLLGDLDH